MAQYHLLGKIYDDERLKEYETFIVDSDKELKSKSEIDDPSGLYGNSYGINGDHFAYKCLNELTSTIEAITNQKLRPVNPYCRIYKNGSKLGKHIDRPTLDWTLTICLGHNLDKDWPFYFDIDGEVIKFSNDIGYAALIEGTKTIHWRDPLVCEDWQYSTHMFLHWETIKQENNEINRENTILRRDKSYR